MEQTDFYMLLDSLFIKINKDIKKNNVIKYYYYNNILLGRLEKTPEHTSFKASKFLNDLYKKHITK